MHPQKLTNLQLELLKVFSYQLNQQQLTDIKNLLANYFANQATQEMDKLWEENNLDNNTMAEWANEHLSMRSFQLIENKYKFMSAITTLFPVFLGSGELRTPYRPS
jgi:hypothetical protein